MKKLRIYLETTLFNYYLDTERDAHKATVQLFEEIKHGKFEAYTSVYVYGELTVAEEPKRSKMLKLIDDYKVTVFARDENAERLADLYIEKGIVPPNSKVDARHIAMASVKGLDCIVSMNFAHINRAKTRLLVPHINKLEGYDTDLQIFSPMEVVDNGD